MVEEAPSGFSYWGESRGQVNSLEQVMLSQQVRPGDHSWQGTWPEKGIPVSKKEGNLGLLEFAACSRKET